MAPLQDVWYLEIILHLIHGSLGGYSSTFSSTFSLLSKRNAIFDTSLSKMLLLFTLRIFNPTLCKNSLLPQYVGMSLYICQSLLKKFTFCKIRISESPTFKFLSISVVEVIARIPPATPEFVTICCTCLHFLHLHQSDL